MIRTDNLVRDVSDSRQVADSQGVAYQIGVAVDSDPLKGIV